MATRSRTSFQKRQKELQRAEKQRDKAARRLARKLAPKSEDGELLDQDPEAASAEETNEETGENAGGENAGRD